MLGERRSKAAFYAGFGESVQEETAPIEPASEPTLEHASNQSTDRQVGPDDLIGNRAWEVYPEAEMNMDGCSNQQQEEAGPRQEQELMRDATDEEEYVPPKRPVRSLRAHDLFFSSGEDSRAFSDVLREVQGYLSKEYSSLVT